MERYRYRTGVLVGPWRTSRALAVADAIRSNQAEPGADGDDLTWRVSGRIEVSSAVEQRKPRRR